MQYQKRTYRNNILKGNLVSYQVQVRETDLYVSSDIELKDEVLQSIYKYRSCIEGYIKIHPHFLSSLMPLSDDDLAPDIVKDMIEHSRTVNVGPMAAVAGAIAQYVGYDLLNKSSNVIIENGGDIFLKCDKDVRVGVFAGESPLKKSIVIKISKEEMPLGICTSSGTVGPSLSFGNADAVCVKAKSASLADAAATAIGNRVKTVRDIKKVLKLGYEIPGIMGVVIIIGDNIGIIGDIELI